MLTEQTPDLQERSLVSPASATVSQPAGSALGGSSAFSPGTERSKFVALFLNSTACYLLAYQLCHFVYQFMLLRKAGQWHIPGILDASSIRFTLAENAWRHNSVMGVYGTSPMLMLVVAAVSFVLFWQWLRWKRGIAKLLLLWLCLHSVNAVLGGLLADSVTQSGSWFVPNWMVAANVTWPGTVLGLFAGIIQLVLGFLVVIPFLLAQESRTILQFERRPQLIRYTIIGPWLAASVLLAVSKLPWLSINETLRYVTMGLLLGPLAIGVTQQTLNRSNVQPRATHVAWGLVVLAVLALIAWRVVLNTPIEFR